MHRKKKEQEKELMTGRMNEWTDRWKSEQIEKQTEEKNVGKNGELKF